MSSYLPSAELTALLPSDHGYDAGELAAFITKGSEMVDSELAHLYWVPFTDYAASPAATPPYPVRVAAAWFAAWFAYSELGMTNELDDDAAPQKCYTRARGILAPFRDEQSGKALQILAPETATEQFYSGSSWGDGDPYTSDQIALGVTRGEVLTDSVRVLTSASAVTDYQVGEDFAVAYNTGTRKWVFTRYVTGICSQATATPPASAESDGDKVQYEVIRVKKREQISAKTHSVEIVRG